MPESVHTRDNAARLLNLLAEHDECPLNDARLPPPDVFAFLADHGIRRAEITLLGDLVRRDWSTVRRIDCVVTTDEDVHLDIQVEPFQTVADARARHRDLIAWFRTEFPAASKIHLHFYPVLDPNRIRSSTTIYEADNVPAHVAA